ncbi:MAG: hypothetical protein AAGA78_08215, partial [Pseudomonadota bacterium]
MHDPVDQRHKTPAPPPRRASNLERHTAQPPDPRHILDRVVAQYGAQDLTPVSAVELEFYVFDQQGRAPGGLAEEGVLDL